VGLKNKNLFPKRVNWFITNKCNLKCKYCYLPQSFWSQKEKVSIKELFFALSNKNISQIDILGGEPFLEKEKLIFIFRACQNSRIKIKSISTNGIILDNEILSELRKIKGFVVQVSLDASTPQTYKKVRGFPYFLKVVKNINLLVKNKIRTILSFVITKENRKEIKSFIKLSEELEVEGVSFGAFVPVGRGGYIENLMISFDEIHGILRLIENIKSSLKIFGIKEKGCSAGTKEIAMLQNGDLYPCGLLISFREAKIGNIFNNNIFLNNKWFLKFINLKPPPLCHSCSLPSLCCGACKAFIYKKSLNTKKYINYLKFPCKNLT